MTKFSDKLHSTYQTNEFYTDSSNLPIELYNKLLESNIEFHIDACGGYSTKLELDNVLIDNELFDISYTVEYREFESMTSDCNEENQEEMISRANEFLTEGLVSDIRLTIK